MSSSVSEPHPHAAAGESPAPAKPPRSATPRGDTTPPKARSGRKAVPPQKSAKGAQRAASVRKGSKTAKILALLERSGGATVKQLMQATGWQPHSVRGFLSGVVNKKMGLKVHSTEDPSGQRRYAVKS